MLYEYLRSNNRIGSGVLFGGLFFFSYYQRLSLADLLLFQADGFLRCLSVFSG
ncbi:hypothetical protein [Geminisphaera colitermitum]|uniref:hypothetical protein n=1 Tax=Geminisphaera colitermitum TaxID=1148786 RepID=UPI000305928A|nr:hypothetical protein [Geminisphaera colitermitum]